MFLPPVQCEECWERFSWRCCRAIRVSVDVFCLILDCALGVSPSTFLFGCKGVPPRHLLRAVSCC